SAEGGRCGTALNSASFVGHLWTVLSLLRHGVSVDVRFRLKHGAANLNLHDDNRNNPLTLAAHRGRVDIVRVLLERNADFKSQDRRGRTPLHDGSNYPFDHFQVAQLLLEHGANQN
ncbi:Ankyrin repeat-containing domain protein, partial [Lactarius tabidus]